MQDCALTTFGKRIANDLADALETYGSIGSNHRLLSMSGLTKLASGGQREVFTGSGGHGDVFYGRDDECVLKVATNGYTSQNENEIATWGEAPPEVRDVLAPVVEYAGDAGWLTMPRVSGWNPGDEDKILDALSAAGWTCEDMHHANYGRLDGEPVMLDYGFKCYPKGTEGERIYDIREEMF